jgi:hypothetical protein
MQCALLDALLSTNISLPKFFSPFDQENKERGADKKVKKCKENESNCQGQIKKRTGRGEGPENKEQEDNSSIYQVFV